MSMASRADLFSVAMGSSGFRISTSLLTEMCAAVTSAGPFTSSRSVTGSSLWHTRTRSLRLRMMSVTSSVTPWMVSNSWRASSNRSCVMAAPGIEDSRVRRRELPSVWPKPGSSGLMAKVCRLPWASPIASTVGRWMTSMIYLGDWWGAAGERGLLGVELDDELLAHGHVDLLAHRELAHGDGLAALALVEPRRHAHVERVEVVLDDDHRLALVAEGDDVALLHAVARDVDPAAVHVDQPVVHELAGLRAGAGPAG